MITDQLTTAWKLFDSGDAAGAEALYLQCLVHADTLENDALSFLYMGLIYAEGFLGKFQEARLYAKLLLQCAKNKKAMHTALHQSGMIERMAGNYVEAMAFFRQEIALIQDAFPKDDMLFAANLYEQGILHMNMNDLAQARERMQCSLTYALASQDTMCIGCSYRGLGEILCRSGQFSPADTCFLNAISAFQSAGDLVAVQEVENMRSVMKKGL